MNYIYWQPDKIGFFTNTLNAQKHSHWMLQLFLSLDGLIEIEVDNKKIEGRLIVIDKNVSHAIDTKGKVIFSVLITPASPVAVAIQLYTNPCGYWVYNQNDIGSIQQKAQGLASRESVEKYMSFSKILYQFLGVKPTPTNLDPRVSLLIQLIKNCTCDNHAISIYANKLSLSPSRLSHLFKAETGIPLKSYIVLHQVERAFSKLLSGQNITEAALDAGFDSPSHFAATVKRMMGMPASLSTKDSVFLKVSDI